MRGVSTDIAPSAAGPGSGIGWGSLAAFACRHYSMEVLLITVGRCNDMAFNCVVHLALEADGLARLHTIGTVCTDHGRDDWIDAHVFPGGRLPSASHLSSRLEGLFLIEG